MVTHCIMHTELAHTCRHISLCWCAHRCKSRSISLLALAALTCLQSCASTPNGVAIFLKGDAECRWVVSKIVIFGQHLALSRKQYKTEPYYGMRIGNRTHAFEWYHWMTLNDSNRDFKVTALFDAEYIGNSMRYIHSYSWIPIGQARPSRGCHFEWPSVT